MQTDTLEKPDAREKARKSYSGSRLTNAQFDEVWNICGIIHRETHRSGSFIDKLTDHARTFAGRDQVDASREEHILRDIYAERYGQSMNQTREKLLTREAELRDDPKERQMAAQEAYEYAQRVCDGIVDGDNVAFYQSYDTQAVIMAQSFNISEVGAKRLMAQSYEAQEGQSLYKDGKALEAEHYTPARRPDRAEKQTEYPRRSRSGPAR